MKRSANEAKVAKVSSASAETDFIHVYTHAHTHMRNLFMFSYLNYICTAVTLAEAKYTNKYLLVLLQATAVPVVKPTSSEHLRMKMLNYTTSCNTVQHVPSNRTWLLFAVHRCECRDCSSCVWCYCYVGDKFNEWRCEGDGISDEVYEP